MKLVWSTLCWLFVFSFTAVSSSTKIGAFNVKWFGRSKMSKPEVVEVLVDIVRRYDILLIQEIRDSTETAIRELVDEVNSDQRTVANDDRYELTMGSRVGRTSYKEQYAFIYRASSGIRVQDTYEYDDGDESEGEDTFEREPYVVRFHLPYNVVSDVALVAIHVKPSDAVAEIDHLVDVHDTTKQIWRMEDIMILGDLNADCSYVGSSDWKHIGLKTDEGFRWLIDDEADTTVSGNTDCAYDRFVATGHHLNDNIHPSSVRVFRFDEEYGLSYDEAKDVSDHYPIELELL